MKKLVREFARLALIVVGVAGDSIAVIDGHLIVNGRSAAMRC